MKLKLIVLLLLLGVTLMSGCATNSVIRVNRLFQMMQEKKVGHIVLEARREKWFYRPAWFWPPSWSSWEKDEIEQKQEDAIIAAIIACLREENLWSDTGDGFILIARRSYEYGRTLASSEDDGYGNSKFTGVYLEGKDGTYWEFRVKPNGGNGISFEKHSLVESLRAALRDY